MQSTIAGKTANRLARQERDLQLDALADFASLGDVPDDWRRFREKHPQFFPEWLYATAEARAAEGLVKESGAETPLLLYRDMLRAVWSRNDPDGNCLKFLLGFEQEAAAGGLRFAVVRPIKPNEMLDKSEGIGGLRGFRPDAEVEV